jgi:hypothetical protein
MTNEIHRIAFLRFGSKTDIQCGVQRSDADECGGYAAHGQL